MSTWTLDAFDNNAAQTWVRELVQCTDLSLLDETLGLAVQSFGGYLEKEEGERALAALEVLAALRGHPSSHLLEQVPLMQWLAHCEPEDLTPTLSLGRRTCARLLRQDSELHQYWQDQGEVSEWCDTVQDLRERLR